MYGCYSHLLSLIFCNEIISQIQGSAQQIISMFVSITKMEDRWYAEVVLQENGWNFDKAIAWFHEHKNDDKYRIRLKKDCEGNTEKYGKYDVSKFKLFLVYLDLVL